MLEDDDLELLKDNAEFISLKSTSDTRYAEAVSGSKALFSWERMTAGIVALFLCWACGNVL